MYALFHVSPHTEYRIVYKIHIPILYLFFKKESVFVFKIDEADWKANTGRLGGKTID